LRHRESATESSGDLDARIGRLPLVAVRTPCEQRVVSTPAHPKLPTKLAHTRDPGSPRHRGLCQPLAPREFERWTFGSPNLALCEPLKAGTPKTRNDNPKPVGLSGSERSSAFMTGLLIFVESPLSEPGPPVPRTKMKQGIQSGHRATWLTTWPSARPNNPPATRAPS
jgi:hypothetical protein